MTVADMELLWPVWGAIWLADGAALPIAALEIALSAASAWLAVRRRKRRRLIAGVGFCMLFIAVFATVNLMLNYHAWRLVGQRYQGHSAPLW